MFYFICERLLFTDAIYLFWVGFVCAHESFFLLQGTIIFGNSYPLSFVFGSEIRQIFVRIRWRLKRTSCLRKVDSAVCKQNRSDSSARFTESANGFSRIGDFFPPKYRICRVWCRAKG